MVTRDTYALLIAGDEQCHVDASIQFRNYLTHEAKFKLDRIWTFVDGDHYYLLDKVRYFIQEAKAKTPNKLVVIAYNGHGVKGGITPSTWGQNSFISYEDLGSELCHHEGRTLFINDCCHSGSAIPEFKEAGILPNKGSVITSSDADELSYGNIFQERFLKTIREKQPFSLSPVNEIFIFDCLFGRGYYPQHPQRCGLSLDHLLFPQ